MSQPWALRSHSSLWCCSGLVTGSKPSSPCWHGAAESSIASRLRRKHSPSPQVGICGSAVPASRTSRCWRLQRLRSWASPSFSGWPAARLGSSQVLLQASLAAWGRRTKGAARGTASAAETGIRYWRQVEGGSHGRARLDRPACCCWHVTSASVQTGPSSTRGQRQRSDAGAWGRCCLCDSGLWQRWPWLPRTQSSGGGQLGTSAQTKSRAQHWSLQQWFPLQFACIRILPWQQKFAY